MRAHELILIHLAQTGNLLSGLFLGLVQAIEVKTHALDLLRVVRLLAHVAAKSVLHGAVAFEHNCLLSDRFHLSIKLLSNRQQ